MAGTAIVAEVDGAAPQDVRLEQVLHALGDPVRLGIVRQLAREGECSCAALNRDRSKSTMSHHFRVLRDVGIVQTRGQGVTHMNALRRAALDAAFPGLLAAVIGPDAGAVAPVGATNPTGLPKKYR